MIREKWGSAQQRAGVFSRSGRRRIGGQALISDRWLILGARFFSRPQWGRTQRFHLSPVQILTSLVGLLIAACLTHVSATTLDFEGFADSTILTNQYSGLTFPNAIILTAGISLNEFEFPPHSGVNVVSDNTGPMTIDFSTPVLNFGGYFTYLEPITIHAFITTSHQVATARSLFSNNLACLAGPPCSGDPGSSPNEFMQVSFAGGISRISITGDPAGGSFTLDDATYGTAASVPEPRSDALILLGGLIVFAYGHKRFALLSKMKTYFLSAAIILAALAGAVVIIFASILPKPPADTGVSSHGNRLFANDIEIVVPATLPEQEIQNIVSSSHGVLLGPTGLSSGVRGTGLWDVEVTNATSDASVIKVRDALASHPEVIRNAYLDPLSFPQ